MNGTDADTVRAGIDSDSGSYTEQDNAHAALDRLVVRVADAEKALARVKENAESWHGLGEDGPRRALVVIARWCDEALSPGAAAASGDGQPPGDFYPSDWAG